MNKKKCFLISVASDNANVKILLQDKLEILLGRCPETNIKDKRCSRNQISLVADYASDSVAVKHLGGNASTANGVILKNDSYVIKHGEVLEFLVGQYPFRIEFDPTNSKEEKRQNSISKDNHENGFSEPKRCCKDSNKSPMPVSCATNMWEKVDDGKLYVFTSAGVTSSSKVAAYDMDGTIIVTKSGRVFPKDNDDWVINSGGVRQRISKLSGEGYKIVILTNQAGIGRGKTNINEFKTKIENIVRALNVPVQVFIATNTSMYRKPAPGMWTYLESKKNDGIEIDMASSFYVGDAGGRIVNWAPGKKKDFSSADRLLALNLNLRFSTPEEHFSQAPLAKYALPPFNPAALDQDTPLSNGTLVSNSKEVVLMVGSPGSGKSHFALRHLVPAGYSHVSRDSLGSWQKCVLSMEAALAAGRSVVVDNTNPDRESRQRFITRVPASVPCRCFLLTTTIEHIRHNNRFRELTDKNHIPVNDMIINSYKNKFEAPSLEEGFTEILNINFVPSFSDPELKKIYQMYLLEK